ncbi:sensor domain-containing diguanylate cyclase [Shewanella sp. NIFS-20-20]|uniref:GGDEF domain-containing protein n=1 Tax=Shewanella sp. NIFS-20-20 TaxID=2853806 RepID=UPI001C495927|nr:sensor domain-containing diguanylate cyclase [Shewanella sp. NIFS-20-20]MBV7315684.1 sensor domain-containing diguanylate cyclase [Shewanella sp. NIFS-20-20]
MQSPHIPEDEASRLHTLRSLNILDTANDERFDRVTRMAKRLFTVPIALVSLIDEQRQWFKSSIGLQVKETDRDISFCGHAILGKELFVVHDARVDPRFCDNPLVIGAPHIRFYAGCPLKLADGTILGTLCIIDTQPRLFDDDDRQAMIDLAVLVELELQAMHLATIDELTQIPNRRGFSAIAQQSINVCSRQQISACLAFIDLDKFKAINDTYGHAEGDNVLTLFAQELQATCRSSDIVARLSGDEFVILFTNTTLEEAHFIMNRLQHNLHQVCQETKRPYQLYFSCGLVRLDGQQPQSIDELLRAGDALMYQQKQQRKSAPHH